MKVEILLIGKNPRISQVPSRYDIYRETLRDSEFAQYATHSFRWTLHSLWGSLRNVSFVSDDSLAANIVNEYYAYRGEVEVGLDDFNVDVLVCMGSIISAAIPNMACRIVISPSSHGLLPTQSGHWGTSDPLLFHLGRCIERTPEFRSNVLQLADVTEWNYHKELEGRLWFVQGTIRILPNAFKDVCFHRFQKVHLPSVELLRVLFALGPLAKEENALTREFNEWLEKVALLKMRQAAVTFCISLTPVIAGVVKHMPAHLLHECLLYHLVTAPTLDVPPLAPREKESQTGEHNLRPHDALQGNGSRLLESNSLEAAREELKNAEQLDRMVRSVVVDLPRYFYDLMQRDPCAHSGEHREGKEIKGGAAASPTNNEHEADFIDGRQIEKKLGACLTAALVRWQSFLADDAFPVINSQSRTQKRRSCYSFYNKVLRDLYRRARAKVDRLLLGAVSSEAFEKYRRKILYPYPPKFQPAPIKPWVAVMDEPSEAPVEDLQGLSLFHRFDKTMLEEDDDEKSDSCETVSTYTSHSSADTSSSCQGNDEEIDETRKELESIFFEDLHLVNSHGKGAKPSSLDQDAVTGIVKNSMFSNTIKLIADG